jgi:hypothetical protein
MSIYHVHSIESFTKIFDESLFLIYAKLFQSGEYMRLDHSHISNQSFIIYHFHHFAALNAKLFQSGENLNHVRSSYFIQLIVFSSISEFDQMFLLIKMSAQFFLLIYQYFLESGEKVRLFHSQMSFWLM